jgi:hypothetical protein
MITHVNKVDLEISKSELIKNNSIYDITIKELEELVEAYR